MCRDGGGYQCEVKNGEVSQVLNDPVARRLLTTGAMARLAYNSPDGSPRVVPIGFLWRSAALVMCTATDAPKVKALERDPRVAVTIDTDAPLSALLVRGVASVEIVDGIPDEYLEASHRGLPEERWSQFEEDVRALYPAMARISVSPRWAKVLDFETRLPSAVERLMAAQRSGG